VCSISSPLKSYDRERESTNSGGAMRLDCEGVPQASGRAILMRSEQLRRIASGSLLK